jgi:hypothetical protein
VDMQREFAQEVYIMRFVILIFLSFNCELEELETILFLFKTKLLIYIGRFATRMLCNSLVLVPNPQAYAL